jgi:hypothetical protein
MFDKIKIKDVKQFDKDHDDKMIYDFVDVTLTMPLKIWALLKKMIETSYIFNKRKHDNPDGSASLETVFEKILDVAKSLETKYFKFYYNNGTEEYFVEVGSHAMKGTLTELSKMLEEIERKCPKDLKSIQ